jgi:hypothetical protein
LVGLFALLPKSRKNFASFPLMPKNFGKIFISDRDSSAAAADVFFWAAVSAVTVFFYFSKKNF